MNYTIIIDRVATKGMRQLSHINLKRIDDQIRNLSKNPFPSNSSPLKNSGGAHRLRIGKCRVVYRVNEEEKTVNVLDVDNRNDVYR